MGIKITFYNFFAYLVVGILLFLFVSRNAAFAENGAISVVPESATETYGQEFNVDVEIDGGGTAFNAAKATVTLSPELAIQSLTLGNCGFALVRTPTESNPSFAGVILGGSSNVCTIYTLIIKGKGTGTGHVLVSDASIKSYKGAGELLSSVRSGSYTIVQNTSSGINFTTVSAPSPTQAPLVINGAKLYNILYTVSLPKNIPASSVIVTLDPQLPSKISAAPATEPGSPQTVTATFQNVSEGVHTITAYSNDRTISTQIANITGSNRNLEFGTSTKQGVPSWIWYLIGVILAVLLIVVGVFAYKYFRKRSVNPNPSKQPGP